MSHLKRDADKPVRRPTYILLDPADREKVEDLAEQEGLALSTWLRRLVMQHLRRPTTASGTR